MCNSPELTGSKLSSAGSPGAIPELWKAETRGTSPGRRVSAWKLYPDHLVRVFRVREEDFCHLGAVE